MIQGKSDLGNVTLQFIVEDEQIEAIELTLN